MAYIYGTDYSDELVGTSGADEIYGYGGHDLLEGRGGDDYLSGGAGNDDLIGGTGYNDLRGGTGSDWFIMSARGSAGFSDDYILDFTFDVDLIDVSSWGVSDFGQIQALLEDNSAGEATLDAFYGGLRHVITIANVAPEDLAASDFVYSTSGPRNLAGTSSHDVLFGSRYADTLNGGAGDDELLGGMGDDTLIGSTGVDYFNGGSGFDRVSFTYTSEAVNVNLATGVAAFASGVVETLDSIEAVTGSSGANVLTGNSAANSLNGFGGNDALNGGLGSDLLIGGSGNDSFTFSSLLGSSNIDTIDDFYAPSDLIRLDNAVFTALSEGTLSSAAYREGNFSSAQDASDRIIYNDATGGLFYDSDGIGGAASRQFAWLDSGLAGELSRYDFLVV